MRVVVDPEDVVLDGRGFKIGWGECPTCVQTTLYDPGLDVLLCPWCNRFLESPCGCRPRECAFRRAYERLGRPANPLGSALQAEDEGAALLLAAGRQRG